MIIPREYNNNDYNYTALNTLYPTETTSGICSLLLLMFYGSIHTPVGSTSYVSLLVCCSMSEDYVLYRFVPVDLFVSHYFSWAENVYFYSSVDNSVASLYSYLVEITVV